MTTFYVATGFQNGDVSYIPYPALRNMYSTVVETSDSVFGNMVLSVFVPGQNGYAFFPVPQLTDYWVTAWMKIKTSTNPSHLVLNTPSVGYGNASITYLNNGKYYLMYYGNYVASSSSFYQDNIWRLIEAHIQTAPGQTLVTVYLDGEEIINYASSTTLPAPELVGVQSWWNSDNTFLNSLLVTDEKVGDVRFERVVAQSSYGDFMPFGGTKPGIVSEVPANDDDFIEATPTSGNKSEEELYFGTPSIPPGTSLLGYVIYNRAFKTTGDPLGLSILAYDGATSAPLLLYDPNITPTTATVITTERPSGGAWTELTPLYIRLEATVDL